MGQAAGSTGRLTMPGLESCGGNDVANARIRSPKIIAGAVLILLARRHC